MTPPPTYQTRVVSLVRLPWKDDVLCHTFAKNNFYSTIYISKYAANYTTLLANGFTGKERDAETGYGYFGARYMDHELMTMWLSVDPMADKYPSISPYAYCVWNPIKLVDPDGRDTVNIRYDKKNNQWVFDSPILSKGDDVFNVTDAEGNITQTFFSEEKYGERMCVLNIEEIGNCTLGVYHISGQSEEWATGYAVTPAGVPSLQEGSGKRLPDGTYPLTPTEYTQVKWVQPIVYKERAIKIHPMCSKSSWYDAYLWTSGCYIIGTEYRIEGGVLQFKSSDSKSISESLNIFLGGKHHSSIGKKGYPGATFSDGMKKMSLIQKGGVF